MKKVKSVLNTLRKKVVDDEVEVSKREVEEHRIKKSVNVVGSFRLSSNVTFYCLWFKYEIKELEISTEVVVNHEHKYQTRNEFLQDCLNIIKNKERLKQLVYDEIMGDIRYKKNNDICKNLKEQIEEAIKEEGNIEFDIELE